MQLHGNAEYLIHSFTIFSKNNLPLVFNSWLLMHIFSWNHWTNNQITSMMMVWINSNYHGIMVFDFYFICFYLLPRWHHCLAISCIPTTALKIKNPIIMIHYILLLNRFTSYNNKLKYNSLNKLFIHQYFIIIKTLIDGSIMCCEFFSSF